MKIAKEYLNGESSVELGRKYGYHSSTIIYHLKKLGIRIRSPAEGSRLVRKKWNKHKVLLELSKIAEFNDSPSWTYLYKNYPKLLGAIIRYFGSLNKAKKCLGLKCNRMQERFHLPSDAKKITPSLGYVFGAYLGDGLKTDRNKIEIYCGRDEDFTREVSRCIKNWLGKKPTITRKSNCNIVRLCGVEIKRFFKSLENFDWIKNAPIEVKKAIVRGLWDSEGAVGKRALCFCVTDRKIADLFHSICNELEIETKTYYNEKDRIYKVHIYKLEDRIKFYNEIGITSRKKRRKFQEDLIRNSKYALEDYLKVIELRRNGLGSRKISKLTGIPRTTVRNWINGYKKPPCTRLLSLI